MSAPTTTSKPHTRTFFDDALEKSDGSLKYTPDSATIGGGDFAWLCVASSEGGSAVFGRGTPEEVKGVDSEEESGGITSICATPPRKSVMSVRSSGLRKRWLPTPACE